MSNVPVLSVALRGSVKMAWWILAVGLMMASPTVVTADTCDVPASYANIQAAVNDFDCTEIYVTAGRFFGNVTIPRSLLIQGASSTATTIHGKVKVEGQGTSVALEGLRINVNPDGLPHNGLVTDGFAETLPDDLVIGYSDLLFLSGFERGNASDWSSSVP